MPAYMNGKKIKDLHYGGRKIKEAWYNGKKVYTSFVIPPSWRYGISSNAGDVVYEIDRYKAPGYIFTFRCKQGGYGSGQEGPSIEFGNPEDNYYWEFLEKIPVDPFPPENYRGYG